MFDQIKNELDQAISLEKIFIGKKKKERKSLIGKIFKMFLII